MGAAHLRHVKPAGDREVGNAMSVLVVELDDEDGGPHLGGLVELPGEVVDLADPAFLARFGQVLEDGLARLADRDEARGIAARSSWLGGRERRRGQKDEQTGR